MSRPRITRAFLRSLFFAVFIISSHAFGESHACDEQTQDSDQPLILAHYMPWYTAKPFSDQWGWHWTMNHFDPDKQSSGKREIASRFYPLIGPYDSGEPAVLEFHLLLMKLAGIDGVIVDWYGLTDFRDYAILHRNTTRLLQQCERLNMKFVICYEDHTIPLLVEASHLAESERVSHAVKELEWLSKYWFKSPSYVSLDGKPVLLSFGHAGLTNDEWSSCLDQLTTSVAYFSQDFRRPGASGGFGWPAPNVGMAQVDRFLNDSQHWPDSITAAFPRFIDIYQEAEIGDGYPELPDADGQTFVSTLEKALREKPVIVQLATWNDWGEGTQIEPSSEFGYRDLEVVQRLRREQIDRGFATKADDLRVPFKLFQLRANANNRAQEQACDEIAELIAAGRMTAAMRRLGTLADED